ncbi:ABC transporter substrate-binding protein [Usitatibacter palustris]|uniref:ABC transport system substrate-binding protein n=1 Tax=Usitatibacter palustris TaxID=2732487 RepID=A0A6M4HCX1_9PROT|nr:ABC transporter substrate-binding protein [Usitatibacter palustris]QJR16578.1 hypothetical protein DSM104440_03413 [Usitatibacter palustris]
MTTRRQALALLAAAAAAPLASRAAEKYRLYMVTWRGMTDVEKGFKEYIARHNIPVEYIWRDANQDRAKLTEFSKEIAATKPDLIYTWGTSATLGITGPADAPNASLGSIPVVFALVAHPTGAKIVTALDKPGRDVTGVYHVATVAAQLEAMRAYRPFTKLGTLYNPAELNSVATINDLRAEAQRRGVTLLEEKFALGPDSRPLADGIEERVTRLKAAGAQWLYLGPDSYLFTQIERVAAAANKEKLLTFATTESALEGESKVLAGLVSRFYSIGEFAAFKAEQILVGKKKAHDIPIETLTRFQFVVRMGVAKAIDALPPITLFHYAEFRE